MKEVKELAKLLDPYENSGEDFYYRLKKYYQEGITTSVSLPFTPSEVKADPHQVVTYLSNHHLLCIEKSSLGLDETMSLLFELGPTLFKGDEIEVLILDEKVKTLVGIENKSKIINKKSCGYTIQVKLKKEGRLRKTLEKDFQTLKIANLLKHQLSSVVVCGLEELLETSDPLYKQEVLELSKKIAQEDYGVKVEDKKDLVKINSSSLKSDLGFKDIYELYVLIELLQDESFWLLNNFKTLKKELKQILSKRKQSRIDGGSIIIT